MYRVCTRLQYIIHFLLWAVVKSALTKISSNMRMVLQVTKNNLSFFFSKHSRMVLEGFKLGRAISN